MCRPHNPPNSFFLIGAIIPIPFYFLARRYPDSWYKYFNAPVFFTGTVSRFLLWTNIIELRDLGIIGTVTAGDRDQLFLMGAGGLHLPGKAFRYFISETLDLTA